MHFWIDKPTARYCGFRGRRYPSMSFPKTHFGQNRRCGSLDVARLQMVTPVHRLQSANNGGNFAGPSSNLNSVRPFRQSGIQNDNRNNLEHSGLVEQENISNITNNNNNQSVLPQSTSTTNRSLLNFSEFNDAEMAGYRLRCSVWIIFVLATGFVAAAKFYFDHQGAGLEVLVFCGLLVILLMSGCFYSLICRHTQSDHRQETQPDSVTTVTVANTIPNESIRQIPMPRQNPPPPYHIAILISSPTLPDEAPPPAYDKVIQ